MFRWVIRRRVVRRRRRKASKTSRVHYAEHKERARELVHAKLVEWNTFYGFSWNKVFIKNMRSRWGSCSAKGNLNFNYKLALLPEELLDYVIIHELCHLKEFNHSKKFWDLVAVAMPQWEKNKRELRHNERFYIDNIKSNKKEKDVSAS